MLDFAAKFQQGLSYEAFLEKYGTEVHRQRWAGLQQQVVLTSAQTALLQSFTRQMKVLCLAGAWCGDCVNQCPIFWHFAQATNTIALRFVDRDADAELAAELSVCGAPRVPAVLFMSEDDTPVGRYGDRTLSQYRKVVADLTGPTCPTGIGGQPQSILDAVTQDWLNEFERIHWLLRTSGRLRKLHND